jgi:hypothetical protein
MESPTLGSSGQTYVYSPRTLVRPLSEVLVPSTAANSETTIYLESSGQSVNKTRSETANLMGGDEVSYIGFPWFRRVSEVSADPQPGGQADRHGGVAASDVINVSGA